MEADANVTDNGERMVPEDDSFCFRAYLSIYNFAGPMPTASACSMPAAARATARSTCSAECGRRSRSMGIDLSEKAIAYLSSRYIAPGLHTRRWISSR